MSGKKTGLGTIAPPPRRSSGNLSQRIDSAKVQFNVRISHERSTYAKVLAAKTGRKLGDLIEEAISLLEDHHGSV